MILANDPTRPHELRLPDPQLPQAQLPETLPHPQLPGPGPAATGPADPRTTAAEPAVAADPPAARRPRRPVPPAPGRPDLGGRLAREWAHLRVDLVALRRARRWGLVDGPVDDLDQVLAAVGYERPHSPAAEARLRTLVLLAADDDLAARTVVQRILPGLLAVVRRRRSHGHGSDTLDELVGAAWVSIRTFNPARRPACLAAALIADADHQVFRAAARRRSAGELPTDFAGEHPRLPVAAPTDPHPCLELAGLLAEARRAGLADEDVTLIRQLLATPTVLELADRLGITARTIRNRRARITNRLRAVALAA